MTNNNENMSGQVEQARLDFLRTLVRSISTAFNLEFVFLAFPKHKPNGPVTTVQAVAVASWGLLSPSFEYDLTEGPCRLVYEGFETFIPCDVALHFPINPTFGWNGYIGMPILDGADEVIGHISALTSKPIADRQGWLDAFRLYAKLASTLITRFTAEAIVGDRLVHTPSSLRGLQHAPYLDPHSRLPNRKHFEDRGAIAFEQAKELQKTIDVLYFVLDNSAALRTTHGGVLGETIASAFGDVLRAHVGPHQGVSARIGSREFAVLVPIIGPKAAEILMRDISCALDDACQRQLHALSPVEHWAGNASMTEADHTFGMIVRRAQMFTMSCDDDPSDMRPLLGATSDFDLSAGLRVVFHTVPVKSPHR